MSYAPTAAVLAAVRAHAAAEAPRECCGVVIACAGGTVYRPCRNVAPAGQQFEIYGPDYAAAEDAGRVVAIVHSHVFEAPLPSGADRQGCAASGLPWLIVNHPVGSHCVHAPAAERAPLIGRPFVHGVHDCWALVRDALDELAGIAVPEFERRHGWDLRGEDLFGRHMAEAGFARVDDGSLQRFDVLILQMGAPVPNHCVLYLGEGQMMHHPMPALSRRAAWGGQWAKLHRYTARHRALWPQPS